MTTPLHFSVTKSRGSFLIPCGPTPSHTLSLSSIDRYLAFGTFVPIFMVYRYGQEPANVIRVALSKALVPYHPLAGRVVSSEEGEKHVDCNGEGAWFVEASANCSLEDVHLLGCLPLMIPKEELLPLPSNPVGIPLMMQVPRFSCGGFVVALVFDHSIVDGIGIAQVFNAVTKIASGLKQPTVEPVRLREHLPRPQHLPITLPMPLDYSIVDLSLHHVIQFKNHFMEQTGQRCSSLDVVMAQLWQCRTRVIGLEPGVDVHLSFAANARHLLSHIIPPAGGYYGNCLYVVNVAAPSDIMAHASLVEILTLISDAKKRLPDEFTRRVNRKPGDEHTAATMGYESINVTDWRQIGFNDVDYGWGAPTYITPAPRPTEVAFPVCVVTKPPPPLQGYRLITQCVKEEHLKAFRDQTTNLTREHTIISMK